MSSTGCKPNYGGVEICISSFFTWEVEGMYDLLHTLVVLRKGDAPLYPLHRRVGGSQN